MFAYHIDRSSSDMFQPGDILIASSVQTSYEETNLLLDNIYSKKITRHGQRYLTNAINPDSPWDNFYETIFEYERRINFPDLPSRFQSLFAIETLDELENWRTILKLSGNEHIWKIKCDKRNAFKCDASWMKLENFDQSILRISYNATQYWQGINRPRYRNEPELLIPGSIQLVERVN